MRQTCPVGGHAVGGGDGPQGDGPLVGAKIAHYADRLDRQQDGEGLPDVGVDAEIMQFLDKDAVGFLEQFDLFGCDVAEYSHAEAGAGERVPLEDFVGNAEVFADQTDLVFEKLRERLDELQVHFLGQAADVVVRFDGDGRAAQRDRFDHVRVKRALDEPFYIADLVGLGLKHVDELAADGLAF